LISAAPANAAVDPNLILNVGTLNRKKGVLELCQIFNLVVEQNANTHLVFVGRDAADKLTGGQSTQQLCEDLLTEKARQRTQFMGAQAYEKVQEFFGRAGVCVFPSYAETFGLAWVEAMACEKALVCSNIGWAPEIVEDGVSGLLIHPSDHRTYANTILELIEDRAHARRLGKAAGQQARARFSSTVVVQQTLNWYRQVLASA
jgi:glycosyltransferase involved in cell wall biosynthesis